MPQDIDGTFVQNQVITDEAAKEGVNSLKIAYEPEYDGATDAYMGAFYNYETLLSTDETTFSADIYMDSEIGMSGLSFLFGLVDMTEESYRTYLSFSYDGSVVALVKSSQPGRIERVALPITWVPNTWYNLKIETSGAQVKYYVDDEMLLEAELASTGGIDQVRFVHDNYQGSVYIDNFKTDEELSVEGFDSENITHLYDRNTKLLTLHSPDAAFSKVSIFNTLGQSVLEKDLFHTVAYMDLSSFDNGLYIFKIQIGDIVKTIKILKE